MTINKEGFSFPSIDTKLCVDCASCVKKCPLNLELPQYSPDFYMAWHKNIETLMHSSSGGAFTGIANYVLDMGGVVFGAYFNKNTRDVEHIYIEKKSELDKLRSSKYYQSNISLTFSQVKSFLKLGRYVLFSGTACQVASLLVYLDGFTDRLITVDVLCHGVSSKYFVQEFLKSKEIENRKTIVDFTFRNKNLDAGGWNSGLGTRMTLYFSDGTQKYYPKEKDTFFEAFNCNYILRESCYNCQYCGINRIADFTIADYWGVESEKVSEHQKKYGISLLLVNSEKAKDILTQLDNELTISKIDPKNAVNHNKALVEPNIRPIKRDKFISYIEELGFDRAIGKVLWKARAKLRLKKMIQNITGLNDG